MVAKKETDEAKVLRLLKEGRSRKQVADACEISQFAVDVIRKKAGLHKPRAVKAAPRRKAPARKR